MSGKANDPQLVTEFRRGRGPAELEARYRAYQAERLTNLLRIFAPIVLVFNVIQFTHALESPWSLDFIARLAFIIFLSLVIMAIFIKYRANSRWLVLTTLFVFVVFACFLEFPAVANPPPSTERPFPYLLLAAAGVYFFSAGGWRTYSFLLLLPLLGLAIVVAVFADVDPNFWTLKSRATGTAAIIVIAVIVREFMERSRRSEFLALEMSAANARLRALDKLKDDFLARTSHELRAPLQSMIGIAEAMSGRQDRSKQGDDEQEEHLDDPTLIARSGRRLAALIDDLLDHTRLKHRDIQLDVRPVDARAMARVVLDLNRPAASAKHLELRNEIPTGFPTVLADENRLQQILQNLIDNAVKYSDAGVIRVQARPLNKTHALIAVSDQGPGISDHARKSLFQSFEDAPEESRDTALGLSISRRLVELHGGELQVHNQPEGGARFHFTLPFAADSQSVAKVVEPEFTSAVNAPSVSVGTIAPGTKCILVVDDEAVNQRVIRGYLENHGYAVATAGSGGDALALLKQGGTDHAPEIHAVVLDLMMPGLSGFDTAREIRKFRGRLELPILITSARASRRDLFAALNAGANDYIPKPVEPGALLLRLDSLLLLAEQYRAGISFEREHEESLRRERQRLLTDLHDHLGAELTDVRISAEALIAQSNSGREASHTLREHIQRAGEMLREEMQLIDDLDLLDENFLAGSQLMLLRRYSSAERELDFHAPLELEEPIHEGLGKNGRSVMHAVIRETATNDLKYGYGPSRWRVSLQDSALTLEIRSATNYSPAQHGTGRGTEHLIRRVTGLGGSVNIDSPGDDLIRIRINVPLAKSPTNMDGKKA